MRRTLRAGPNLRLRPQEYRADRRNTGGIGDLRRGAVHPGAEPALAGFTVESTVLDNGAITSPWP